MSWWPVIGNMAAMVGGVALANRWQLWRMPRPASWPRLLMYHSIAPETPTGMNTAPETFIEQVRWLQRRGCHFCTVSELLESPPPGSVVLTFDDGFANNYFHLFPLLEELQVKATIYLAPNIDGIERLSEAQIREMQASGRVEFGAHSMGHVNLTTLEAKSALWELTESRRVVANLTGAPCTSFAYPFGRFSEQTVQLARQAGFTTAVTTRKRVVEDPTLRPLEIPRISTHGAMDRMQFRVAFTRGRYRF